MQRACGGGLGEPAHLVKILIGSSDCAGDLVEIWVPKARYKKLVAPVSETIAVFLC